LQLAAAFLCVVSASVQHKNTPHHTGGDAAKVRATLPRRALLIDQFQVSFVNKSRGLQRMVGPFMP